MGKGLQKAKKYKPAVEKKAGHANVSSSVSVESDEDNHLLFMISSEVNKNKSSVLCVDSGASQHMTYNKDLLEHYIEFNSPEIVRLGDNREVEAYGKGRIGSKLIKKESISQLS